MVTEHEKKRMKDYAEDVLAERGHGQPFNQDVESWKVRARLLAESVAKLVDDG